MLKELLISSPPPRPHLADKALAAGGGNCSAALLPLTPSPCSQAAQAEEPQGEGSHSSPVPHQARSAAVALPQLSNPPSPPPAPLFCLGTVQETPGAAKEQQQCPGHQCEVGATGWQPALLVVGSQAWTDLHVGSRKAADQLLRVSSYVQGDKTLGNKAS